MEAPRIRGGVAAQTVGIAKDIAPQRAALEEHFLKLVKDQFGGRVLVAGYLVGYHLHLLVYLLLRECAVKDHVGQDVDGAGQLFAAHGGVVDCLLLACVGVEVGAHLLEGVVDMAGVAALRALETHVLDKVGHAALLGKLRGCARAYHVAAIGHFGRLPLKYHPHAAGERGGQVVRGLGQY